MNNFDYCGGNDNSQGYEQWKLASRYNKQTKQVNGFSKPVYVSVLLNRLHRG